MVLSALDPSLLGPTTAVADVEVVHVSECFFALIA
jgi:hypothetical protein